MEVPDPALTQVWVRTVADPVFREALIEDPLRALAGAPDVFASSGQVRQLEELDRDARAALITELVREVYMRGGQARFGEIGPDGRFGGGAGPPGAPAP
jgi:hypothetical protein